MQEQSNLPDLMDQLNRALKGDQSLLVKAFGMLLLGKKFERAMPKVTPEDPTESIIKEPNVLNNVTPVGVPKF